jgi:hypothetical protein
MDNKSKLGYSKDSPYRDEPFINIQSNNITMKDTDQDLLGLGIKNGKIVKVIPMKAGESSNYDFGDVDSVLEMPKFQFGGMFQNTDMEQLGIQTMLPTNETGYNIPTNNSVADIGARPQVQSIFSPQTFGTTQKEIDGRSTGIIQNNQKPQGELLNQKIVDRHNKIKEVDDSPINDYNSQNPQSNQMYNPYGGVDLASAASLFGRSMKEGDAGMGILSGAKLGLGLGRNIMGGYSTQNRNEYVDQWSQDQDTKARNGNYEQFQDGGSYLTREDIDSIKRDTQIDFTDEGANNLFQRTPTQQQSAPQSDVNLGKYKDVGYFDVLQNKEDSISLTNTSKNPHNQDTVKTVLDEIRGLNPGKDLNFDYTPNLEDGGMARKLTGEYAEGLANENPDKAVAELEKGEYMQSPDGEIAEVEGKTHEEGGEKMTAEQMEAGTKVISDNLKIGAENAKAFKDKYDIKISAKDTYATVIDKASKKIGLKSVVEEQEEVIKTIEKNQDTTQTNTQKLNLQFLSKKLQELEQKKAPLEEARKAITDDVYERQEASKPKEKQSTVMEDGGSIDSAFVKSLAEKHGVNYDSAYQMVQEFKNGGGYVPKYQDGKNEQEVTTQTGKNPFIFTNPESQPMTDENRFAAGTVNTENYSERMMALWREFPNLMAENFEIIQDEKGIQDVKPRFGQESVKNLQEGINRVYEENLQKTEQIKDPNKRKELQDAIKAEMFTGEGYKSFDALIGDFTSSRRNIDFGLKEAMGEEIKSPETPEVPAADQGQNKTDSQGRAALPLLPDQSIMPPSAQDAHLKNNYRFNRIEANKVNPEQALANLSSQFETGVNSANQRPDSQRSALLAQMLAGTGNNSNQIINQTNSQNQVEQNRVDSYNAQIGDREMGANANERTRFEKLQMMAKNNTDQDYRDWMKYNSDLNVEKYNTINRMNLMNELFDNYSYENGQVKQKAGSILNSPGRTPQPKVVQTKKK